MLARLDQEYFQKAVENLSMEGTGALVQGSGFLPRALLERAPQALRLRLYKHELDALGPGQALHTNLRQLDTAWQARRTGKSFQFPGDKIARVEREGLRFCYSG